MPSDATRSPQTVPARDRAPGWVADRLDVRLAQRRMSAAQLAGLAAALAAVHESPAPAAAGVAPTARAAAARAAIAAAAPSLAAAAAACEATVRGGAPALAERAACGARRLHGALRCDAIHVDPDGAALLGPAADAAGDPAEDVAALAVDLVARGHVSVARRLVAACAAARGDFGLYRVLDAHLALAALRAAQRALGSDAAPGDAARAAAQRLLGAPAALAPPQARPFLLVVAGGVASGKSTLAARLSEATGAPVASADAVRPPGLDPAASRRAYAEMFRQAGDVLASGRSAIVDACFASRAQRDAARALAEGHGAALLVVECRADATVVRRRLQERAQRQGCEVAEWLALRDAVAAAWEPVRELRREQHLPVETGRDEPDAGLPRVERALARLADAPHRVRSSRSRGAPALA
jgi:predicted kinase